MSDKATTNKYHSLLSPMDRIQLVLVSIVIGLLLALVIPYRHRLANAPHRSSSRLSKPTYLILGANKAGKTALYYKLTNDEQPIGTISSLEPNIGTFLIPFSNPAISQKFQLIDFPGHLKFYQLLKKLILEDIQLKNIKGIIYMVDSSSQSLAEEGKLFSMASFLFNILSLTERTASGVDFLFAINKQDLFDTKRVTKIREMLEDELNKLIKGELSVKGSAAGMDDDDDDENAEISETTKEFWTAVMRGHDKFSFSMLEGNMEFIGGSVLKNKTADWENWFDEKAVNYGGM